MSSCCNTQDGCSTTGQAEGDKIHDEVKEYYGKKVKSQKDLETKACLMMPSKIPSHVKQALSAVHPEVAARYYGCGLVVPECLEGARVLDLGSGTGHDCFALAKLVGEKGHVTGIDMTDEQLDVAREYVDYHRDKFGYSKPNTDFVKGYIEKLGEAGLEDNTFDIIVSNCVVNLSPDKAAVLREGYRVLKLGGELYFSDIYADRDVPEHIRKDKVMWGECLAGALWWEDLVTLAKEVGFCTPRLVSAGLVNLDDNKPMKDLVGDIKFVSVTYRLFKLPQNTSKEAAQVVYNGSVTGHEASLKFDAQYTFQEGDIVEVDPELSAILQESRFADDFTVRPASKKTKADPELCCPGAKGVLTNPFEGPLDKESSCCGPKGCC
ncbi:arsenite methyltransferase-like [Branchiostoma lanceolatum]|uniref:arsenite methyltransferase-like n=1 Tax=Branchiostoma lanceolatum TaxID=7740 RepID=UPI0034528C36